MSYEAAAEKAAQEITPHVGKNALAAWIREILNDAPDEVLLSLNKFAREAEETCHPAKHDAAVLEAGGVMVGYLHKCLSDWFPEEWAEGRLPDDYKFPPMTTQEIKDARKRATG